MKKIVAKGEYAALRKVHPSRVSVWIERGFLVPPALVGEGRLAKIDVKAADAMLSQKLDPGQSLGRGRKRHLAIRAAAKAETAKPGADPMPDPLADEPDLASNGDELWIEKIRYARANAERVELANAATRRELLPVVEVKAGWEAILVSVRGRLLAVPGRLRDKIGLTVTDAEIVAAEIRGALQKLARHAQ